MPHFAASELGLQSLHNILKLVSGLKRVMVQPFRLNRSKENLFCLFMLCYSVINLVYTKIIITETVFSFFCVAVVNGSNHNWKLYIL